MKKYFLLLILFLISSCGTSSEDINEIATFPRYGSYCGLDRPAVGENPPAIDEVDAACKNHDACYATKGSFDVSCDTILITELKLITPKTEQAKLARKWIISYFRNSPQKNLIELDLDKIKL